MLPLYEAKMIHQFDHRFGTYEAQSKAQANKGKLPTRPRCPCRSTAGNATKVLGREEDEVATRLDGRLGQELAARLAGRYRCTEKASEPSSRASFRGLP